MHWQDTVLMADLRVLLLRSSERTDGMGVCIGSSRMTLGTYGTISSFNPLRNNIGIVVILGNVSSLGQI